MMPVSLWRTLSRSQPHRTLRSPEYGSVPLVGFVEVGVDAIMRSVASGGRERFVSCYYD